MIITSDRNRLQEFVDYIKPKADLHVDDIQNCSYIGYEENNKIVGCILFTDYDANNIYIHIAFDTPRCVSRKYIKFMFDYIFNQIKCNRATAQCDDTNARIKKLVEGVGFIREGTMRHMAGNNDLAVYGMLKEECKWV